MTDIRIEEGGERNAPSFLFEEEESIMKCPQCGEYDFDGKVCYTCGYNTIKEPIDAS